MYRPKPPSDAQIEYLRNLGYRGTAPLTSREASEAIQAMLDTKDAAIAEAEVLHERADAPYRYRRGYAPPAHARPVRRGRPRRSLLGSVIAALFWAVVIVVVLALLVVVGLASL